MMNAGAPPTMAGAVRGINDIALSAHCSAQSITDNTVIFHVARFDLSIKMRGKPDPPCLLVINIHCFN